MIVVHLHLTAAEFCQRLSPDVDSFVFLSQKQMFMLYKELRTEVFEVFLFVCCIFLFPLFLLLFLILAYVCYVYADVWVCAHACTWVCRAEKLM